ncbi:MAG: hypothetical protein U1D69_11640 [Polynucleobacter sp.]|nr:hypothetical protein [Polynucleobacter sp.]
MHRIPELVALPDQIERLARELEASQPSDAQLRVLENLRTQAITIAKNIEVHRAITDDLHLRDTTLSHTSPGRIDR